MGPGLIPVSRQSAHRWNSHEPSSRLPLLSTRPVVTFPAREHHCPMASTKLYCLVTETHACEQFAQSCYLAVERLGIKLATFQSLVQCPNHYTTKPHMVHCTPLYTDSMWHICGVDFWPDLCSAWYVWSYTRSFLACDSMLSALSIRLSVRPSHGWISRKRLKLGSCNFHHTVAPSL